MATGTTLTHLGLWLAAGVLIAVGFAGTVLPGLPGVLLIYAGMLLGAWIDHFQRIGWPTLTILGILTGLALVADLIASAFGARRFGASRQAVAGSVIGGLVGPFTGLGLLGLLLGPFLGAVIGELLARRSITGATRVGFGTWLGLVVGTLVKLALAVGMLGVFAAAYLL
jgi:uncharacterized protein YqgC (DUF456 family)